MPIKVEGNKRIVVFSYSSYSLYKKCPAMYKMSKIDHVQDKEDDSFTIPGRVVHKAAENYLKGDSSFFEKDKIKGDLLSWDGTPRVDLKKAYGNLSKVEEFTQRCAENLLNFLQIRDILHKEHFSELWFGSWKEPLMLSDTLGIQGAGDLVEVISPDTRTAILYDYKATWSDKNLNKDQLILYSLALELGLNINIMMSSFFLLPANKHVYITINQESKRELKERLQVAADNILQGNFPCTPGDHCKYCVGHVTCKDALTEFKATIPDVSIPEIPDLPTIIL